MSGRYAKVAMDSPLPQLDRLFDYRVPANLQDGIQVGCRVRVPFGKGAALQDGFIAEIMDSSEHAAADIAELVSPVPVVPASQLKFLRAIADRQAGTLGELLRLSVPKRSVRMEKSWVSELESGVSSRPEMGPSTRRLDFAGRPSSFQGKVTAIAEPRLVHCQFAGQLVSQNSNPWLQGWIALYLAAALECLAEGKSALVLVPDFRDQQRFRDGIETLDLNDYFVDYSSEQVGSARYLSYLKCLEPTPKIILGSRAAAYAPVRNLGAILLWDDIDQSLHEPTAPYIHAREVALIRQQQTGCNLMFAGHSRSAEVQRLVEIGFLKDISANFAPPRIAVTEPGLRVDSASYQAVKEALDGGVAVLVQVAATGTSVSTFCANCSQRSTCNQCNGPLFIDDSGKLRCRWCSALNLNAKCLACGGSKYRQGSAGSTRTAAELGKSFPGVKVVEATFAKRVMSLPAGKQLVVATPGAEPVVAGGYGAVVLLDGQKLLAKDTLRASEQAVDLWSNAVSLLAPSGRAVGVGLASPLGQMFALWDQVGMARAELAQRRELNFPPHHRLASITGPRELLDQMILGLSDSIPEAKKGQIELLGPLLIERENPTAGRVPAIAEPLWRYLLRFDYSVGEALASEIKARALKANSGAKFFNAKTGRASRAVRVKMDDSEVI